MMPDPAAMMGGPPPPMMDAPPDPPTDDADLDPVEHIRSAIEHAQAAQVAEPDDADSEKLSKLIAGLYQILANRQKEHDQTMGNPTLLRTLRRSGGA